MTGAEFVDLAAKLVDGGAAERRTSISRSYYGAFHAAIEVLAAAGVRLPASPEAHQKARFCLLECGELPAIEAGEKLESLRRQRNLADYNLKHPPRETRQNAVVQLRVAREILGCLQTCRSESVWHRARTRIRTYATQVLRLTPVD
ncbi:MAG: hypothetical protein ABSG86_06495 [Thermoguttaceae bacterium]